MFIKMDKHPVFLFLRPKNFRLITAAGSWRSGPESHLSCRSSVFRSPEGAPRRGSEGGEGVNKENREKPLGFTLKVLVFTEYLHGCPKLFSFTLKRSAFFPPARKVCELLKYKDK